MRYALGTIHIPQSLVGDLYSYGRGVTAADLIDGKLVVTEKIPRGQEVHHNVNKFWVDLPEGAIPLRVSTDTEDGSAWVEYLVPESSLVLNGRPPLSP